MLVVLDHAAVEIAYDDAVARVHQVVKVAFQFEVGSSTMRNRDGSTTGGGDAQSEIGGRIDVSEYRQICHAHKHSLLLHGVDGDEDVGTLVLGQPVGAVQLSHLGVQALVDVALCLEENQCPWFKEFNTNPIRVVCLPVAKVFD